MTQNMLDDSAKRTTYSSYEAYPLAQRTVATYALAQDYEEFLKVFPASGERPLVEIAHYFHRLDADVPDIWVDANRIVRFTKVLLALKYGQHQIETMLFSAGLLAAAHPYEDENEYLCHRISGFNPLRPFAGQLPEGDVLAVNLGAYLAWAFESALKAGAAYSNFRWLLGGAINCVRRMPTIFGQTAFSSNASDFVCLTANENTIWLHLDSLSTLDIASFMVACSYYTADVIENQPIWTFHQERAKNPDIWKAIVIANLNSHPNRSVANSLAKCLISGDFTLSMPEMLAPQEFTNDAKVHVTGDYMSVKLQDRVRGCDIPDIERINARNARKTFKQKVAALSDELKAAGLTAEMRGTRKPIDQAKEAKVKAHYKEAVQVMQEMGFNHRQRAYGDAVALVEQAAAPAAVEEQIKQPETISELMEAAKDIFLVREEKKTINVEELKAALTVRFGSLPDDLYITPEGYAVSYSRDWITESEWLKYENGEYAMQDGKRVPCRFTTPATESNMAIATMRAERDMVPGQIEPFGLCPTTGRRNKGDTVGYSLNPNNRDIRLPRDYDPEIGAPMCGTDSVRVSAEEYADENYPHREAYYWIKYNDGRHFRKLRINTLPDFTKPTQEWLNIEQIRCLAPDTAYYEECVEAMLNILEENPLYLSDNDKQIVNDASVRIDEHKERIKEKLAYERDKKAWEELGDEPLF